MKKLTYFTIVLFVLMLTSTLISKTQAVAQVYPEGMVSYWKFEEGSGPIAYDFVGYNDGTLIGASWASGKVGGALDFSGSDYVEVPNSEALNPEHLTLELWTYPTSTGYYHSMAEKQLPGFAYPWAQYALNFWGNTSIPNFNVAINNIAYNVVADEPIPLNAWTYLAGTYDGETLKLYVNGALVKTETSPSGPIDSSPDLFYMGKPPSNAYYHGKLDEVAIYNRALTPEEIQQHYQNGLEGLGYEVIPPPPAMPDDTMAPSGAVHAYPNLVWPPNNKMVTVTLDGYVVDELSMARDGEDIGVSSAYLLIDGTDEIILLDETTDLFDAEGQFSVDIEVKAAKGAEYIIELYAVDNEPEEDGGPNSGLVDSTYIRVPHDMSGGKSGK